MSILGPARKYAPLTSEQLPHAWRLAYRCSLDDHPDQEIAWERHTWRELGTSTIGDVCDELLTKRLDAGFTIPGGANAAGLDRLLAHVDPQPVLRLVQDEGLCLLAAMRLVYWAGLRDVTL